MVNFSTRIPDYDVHSLALLDFFLSSEASICCAMALKLLSQLSLNFHQAQNGMPCLLERMG